MVVLAGGKGTRLAAVLPRGVPKALAPIGERPFLAYLLDWLQRSGAQRVVFSLGVGADAVLLFLKKHKASRGMTITHAVEPRPLGTAGGLRHVLPLVKSDPFIAMNGDSLADVALVELLERHRAAAAGISLALAEVPDASAYGLVELDARGRVTRFAEKSAGAGRGLVNAGVYVIARSAIASLPADTELSWERDVLPRQAGRSLYGLRLSKGFIDIGTPDSLAGAAARLGAGVRT